MQGSRGAEEQRSTSFRPSRELLSAFAKVLEYPWPERDLLAEARTCRRLLAEQAPQAVDEFDRFLAFIEREAPARIEERYTGTFDLNPVVSPYVGYHLFGESYQRGTFMARLKETYAEQNFAANENELPDHLGILLRFLAVTEEEPLATELVNECLLPALERMENVFDESSENPYAAVVRVLRQVVK